MKNKYKILITIIIIFILLFSTYIYYNNKLISTENNKKIKDIKKFNDTISPYGIEQGMSVEICRIHKKGIEKEIRKIGNSWKKNPIYFFEVDVDGEKWIGNKIKSWDTGYIRWEALEFVEDEKEVSEVKISIKETQKSLFQKKDVEIENINLIYDYRTGRWFGDDSFNDSDGYGHYNGKNYEIWFDLHPFDPDCDGIPYWVENNILCTNSNIDDSKLDPDNDGIPTSWEWKWGYDPFIWDNHSYIDSDVDGLENIEEFFMEKWLANPFYQDIYAEVDFMEKGPGIFAYEHVLGKESQYMIMDKFSEHNIALHIDDGWPSESKIGGGEYLDYYENKIDPSSGEGSYYYKYHFNENRKGIFRYVFIQHGVAGWGLPQDYCWKPNVISIPYNKKWFLNAFFPPALTPRLQKIAHAIVLMHELGHSLGLIPSYCEGIDNKSMVGRNDLPPLQKFQEKRNAIQYWENYESVMNYNKFSRYLLDYSDGSHGEHDKDDWSAIDLRFFQNIAPCTYGIGDNFRK